MRANDELLDFTAPPVVEAVVSAEFMDLPELSATRLIDLQREWIEEYPELELRDALPPMALVGPVFQLTNQPSLRIWAVNQASGMLAQLQSNRIAVNWRALDGVPGYPRYARLRDEFEKRWRLVGATLPAGELPTPTTVEFAYVNRIELGDTEVMETFVNWSATTDLGDRVADDFRVVRRVASEGMPDRELKVIGHAGDDIAIGRPVLTLNIEVKAVVGPVLDDWMAVIDQCHLDARRAFQAITTEAAHNRWGKR